MRTSISTAFLVLTAIAIAGCGTMNTSSSELVTKASEKQTACISADQSVVQRRIANYLGACYAGKGGYMLPAGGALIPMSGFHLQQESVTGAIRFSVRTDNFYSMTVDVSTQSEACGTTLNVYAVSGFWKKSMEGVIAAADGNPPSKCP